MDATTRARLEARLADYEAKRELLSTSLASALENGEIQTYSLTDSEGGQSATRRDPASIMKQLEFIDRQIDFISRQLSDRPMTFEPRRH